MITLDDKFLAELGLDKLSKEDKQRRLQQIYATLQNRVGIRISEKLTDEQLTAFDSVSGDEAKITWLKEQIPDYDNLVSEEVNKLKTELQNRTAQFMKLAEESN